MWQVNHERIVTNSLRAARHLSNTSECPFQCQCEESVIHILRDCYKAREVWSKIICANQLSSFFSGNLQVWIQWNSKKNPRRTKFQEVQWTRIFSTTLCWLLWTNRCQFVFSSRASSSQELIHRCAYYMKEYVVNQSWMHAIFRFENIAETNWTPPLPDATRLDVDGSIKTNNEAACGGVFRNSQGVWMLGFCRGIGFATVLEAELSAIKEGLTLALQRNILNLRIFCDSMEAVNCLMRDAVIDHPLRDLITGIRELLLAGNNFQLHFTRRENNQVADYLARQGHY